MGQNQPLVSIGIPTYNRAALLKRSIESALRQDYKNIEIIVSDNASTDGTESVCRFYCDQDARLKYVRQPKNIGPAANFDAVFKDASGQYFMWLGDDDWIDDDYVSSCVDELDTDQGLALVSGTPHYYRNGQYAYTGKIFNLHHRLAWIRLISYYVAVKDNGMFYGLMRLPNLHSIKLQNILAGDWLMIASIVFMGRTKMLGNIAVHRELGGASASLKKLAVGLGLPWKWINFPRWSMALAASGDVLWGACYSAINSVGRILLAIGVLVVLVIKMVIVGGVTQYLCELKRASLRALGVANK